MAPEDVPNSGFDLRVGLDRCFYVMVRVGFRARVRVRVRVPLCYDHSYGLPSALPAWPTRVRVRVKGWGLVA